MRLRHRLRDAAATILSALPHFRGKGRLTLLLDSVLTDYEDPRSFNAVAKIEGVRARVDLRVFSEKFIFYYREYESEYVATVRRLYRGGNFLDVGSNVGIYSVCMADAVRRAGGRIFSIEPLAANVTRQTVNLELNGCADIVEIFQGAVGDEPGTLLMGGDFTTSSINGVVSTAGTVEVEVTTLDELAETRGWPDITMIKMDIEGYEPPVLRGALRLLERNRPILFAEFNRERMDINRFDMTESWLLLKNLGYTGHLLVDGQLRELAEPGRHENLFFLPR